MNIVTSGGSGFVLLVTVAVVVLGVVAALAGRRGGSGTPNPGAYFLLAVSFVSLFTALSTSAVTIHAVSELVGPNTAAFVPNMSGPCSTVYPSTSSPTTSTTLSPSVPSGATLPSNPPAGDFACAGLIPVPANSFVSPSGSGGVSFLNMASSDDTNHYISVAVAAGLFCVVALAIYRLAWRRVRHLLLEAILNPTLERLATNYAYLVAFLAILLLLISVPVAADNIFRAIAPGINQTAGRAGSLRNLVTFASLSALTGAVLIYHLRFARPIRATRPNEDSGASEPEPPATEP